MKGNRSSKTLVILVMSATCAVLPATASGNSLLSGYGGPGQGSQEILGSTLLGGAKAGGGSPGAGGGAGLRAGAATATVGGGQGASTQAGGASAGGSRPGGGSGASSRGRHGSAAGAQRAQAPSGAEGVQLSRARSASGPALGISGDDLVYAVVAVALLALTGLAMRRLARPHGQGGG